MQFAKAHEPETLSSRLLPELFDLAKLEGGQKIRVLDLGAANPQTLRFLSQFNCRLRVVNIRDDLLQLQRSLAEEDLDVGAANNLLAQALDFKRDECFDVCLLWDFLNYLDVSLLSVLAELLLPHLSSGAKVHSFAVLNRNTPLREQDYGLAGVEMLSVVSRGAGTLPFRHGQATIAGAMRGLVVRQSILRADGRLEMVLAACRT